jgi:hypothetical protein
MTAEEVQSLLAALAGGSPPSQRLGAPSMGLGSFNLGPGQSAEFSFASYQRVSYSTQPIPVGLDGNGRIVLPAATSANLDAPPPYSPSPVPTPHPSSTQSAPSTSYYDAPSPAPNTANGSQQSNYGGSQPPAPSFHDRFNISGAFNGSGQPYQPSQQQSHHPSGNSNYDDRTYQAPAQPYETVHQGSRYADTNTNYGNQPTHQPAAQYYQPPQQGPYHTDANSNSNYGNQTYSPPIQYHQGQYQYPHPDTPSNTSYAGGGGAITAESVGAGRLAAPQTSYEQTSQQQYGSQYGGQPNNYGQYPPTGGYQGGDWHTGYTGR